MAIHRFRKNNRRTRESGQAVLFFLLAVGLVLLGALCFAFDLSNMWFHRQAAQTAADAACTAGAMDLLIDANGAATGHQGFTLGTPFDCTSTGSPSSSVCQYAAKNGYNSDNTGNLVYVSFPGSVPGVPSSPNGVANAFIRVDILDHVGTFFAGFLSGKRTSDVRAFAVCGLEVAASPIPILVLDPQSPVSTPQQSALNIQGNGTIAIVGGPSRSIQVNSGYSASTCGQSNCSVNLPWGSAKIDLSKAGPNGNGADVGLWGAPVTAPAGFIPGSAGHWVAPSPPISDPFAEVCAPGQTGCAAINGNNPPPVPGAPALPNDIDATNSVNNSAGGTTPCARADIPNGHCFVSYTTHGCPDPGAKAVPLLTKNNGCVLYTPGAYPNGIAVGPGGSATAIFDPGLYYVTGGLALNSGSTVRPGNGTGDGTQGVTFYFVGSNTVTVNANSGNNTTLDTFSTTTGLGSLPNGIKCTSTSNVPANLPATLTGNILLGPCTGYYGDSLGASDPIGIQRGFLFFQDRSGLSVQPSWGGGGQFLLAGTMYFHSCNATGTGTGCGTAPTYYNDIFSLSGNSGSGTYVLGDIVADNLTLGGTSGITMDLNPTKSFNILKASLLQ